MPKPDPAKERYWRAVIAESAASGLSRAEYCRQNRINQINLQNWIRRLNKRDSQAVKSNASMLPADRSGKKVIVDRKTVGKVNRKHRSALPDQCLQQSVEFAEVRLTQSNEEHELKQQNDLGHLEIIFPHGMKVRLTPGCSLNLLSSVITLLENR